jgi:hypothetical protein
MSPDTGSFEFCERNPLAVAARRRNRLNKTGGNILSSGRGVPICWMHDIRRHRDCPVIRVERGRKPGLERRKISLEEWPVGGRTRDDEWMRTG